MSAMERLYSIEQLFACLSGLLDSADHPAEEVKRICIENVCVCRVHLSHFKAVRPALLRRQRMLIRHHASGTGQETERRIPPGGPSVLRQRVRRRLVPPSRRPAPLLISFAGVC